jgi:nucleoside-diphosphate-sugar epimerase
MTDTAPVTVEVPKRVLVTGTAGRLGRATAALLAGYGVPVVGLDRRPSEIELDRMVVGEVTDPDTVRDALDGVDAVIHCAAIPAPALDTADRVFGRNTLATFVVLEEAAQAGVGRAVLAGTISVLGLAFAPVPLSPAYLPADADLPLQPADPYALGKQADESTGQMISRRYGMTVVTLRYPTLGRLDERLPALAERYRDEPGFGAGALWAYLEDRDAARAAWLAATAPLRGYQMVYVAAPETLAGLPTEELLDRYHPGVPRRAPMPGRTVPVDLSPAAELLGFHAEYAYELPC